MSPTRSSLSSARRLRSRPSPTSLSRPSRLAFVVRILVVGHLRLSTRPFTSSHLLSALFGCLRLAVLCALQVVAALLEPLSPAVCSTSLSGASGVRASGQSRSPHHASPAIAAEPDPPAHRGAPTLVGQIPHCPHIFPPSARPLPHHEHHAGAFSASMRENMEAMRKVADS